MDIPTKENAKDWLWKRWEAKHPIYLFRKVDIGVIYSLADAKEELVSRFESTKERLDFYEFAHACGIRDSESNQRKRRG